MARLAAHGISLCAVLCGCRPELTVTGPSEPPAEQGSRLEPVFVEQAPVEPASAPALTGSVAYMEQGPLAGYTVKLCETEVAYGPCPPDATLATATTNERGEYRFFDMPKAEFWVRVEGLEHCEGLFYETTIGPYTRAEACAAEDATCDLGSSYACRRIPPCVPPE